jgi:hypothetical protein
VKVASRNLVLTVAMIAAAWGFSSLGYFQLGPVLGAKIGYNDAPLTFALYYAAWSLAVFLVFRRTFQGGGDLTPQPLRLAAVVGLAIACAGFALLVVPRLPQVEWTRTNSPVEFFWATSAYFLPKSVEILFQQLLIAALVLGLRNMRLKLWKISVVVAVLFGAFHLTLALSYPNPLYVLRYSVAAAIFGAMVPYILLRVRHGFLLTYAIHWVYYALDIVIIHFAFAAVAPA